MKRSELRKQIFVLLYQSNFYDKEEYDIIFENMKNQNFVSKEDFEYINNKTLKIFDKLSIIDKSIDKNLEKWKISRLPKVDLAILRLGTFELMFDDSIPSSVAIDEAIKLAKTYGGKDSFKFVHSVLAKVSNNE